MMQAWTMVGYGGKHPPGSDDREPMAVLPVLEASGYPAVVAVNCEQAYARYILEGDEIYHHSTIEAISQEKTTALGVGFFVTQLCTYYNQREEVVGTMRFRVLKYRPHAPDDNPGKRSEPPGTQKGPSGGGGDAALSLAPSSLGQLAAGQALPSLAIDITPKLIVAGAIASRDYQDVHHDKDAARALGSPDIFMNILTTNGLVGRFVTDWAGPSARLARVAIRLGAPNYPGDTMTMTGQVRSVDATSGLVELDIKGENSLGHHVTGAVELVLPLG